MPRAVGSLEKRLRDWIRVRLEEKEDERGETAAFAKALGQPIGWVADYLKQPPKRHLNLDQIVIAIDHFKLNIHQVINEMPLPPADYETRMMLDLWLRAKPGSTERRSALGSLMYSVADDDLPLETLLPEPPATPAPPVSTPEITARKHKTGSGSQ